MAASVPVLVAAAACAVTPPPVPLSADPGSAAVLAGRWEGDYWSRESERSGSVVFELNARGDSAVGEVVMVPAAYGRPVRPAHPGDAVSGRTMLDPVTPLRIAFVRAMGDRVSGVLEPYRDPDCGCVLETTFTGRLQGHEIVGRYTSTHTDCGRVTTGQWRVQRAARP